MLPRLPKVRPHRISRPIAPCATSPLTPLTQHFGYPAAELLSSQLLPHRCQLVGQQHPIHPGESPRIGP